MNKIILSIILVLSSFLPAHVYAKWFSEPEEIFETERCLGAFIDGAKILNDRLVESKISNETLRLIDMAVRNDRGYPYILRFEYITDYNDLNDMDQIGGECYVIQLEGNLMLPLKRPDIINQKEQIKPPLPRPYFIYRIHRYFA